MMTLCSDLLKILQGKTIVTAESCTGGGIGAAITAVPGSSAIYKGGIISYCNQLKSELLSVDPFLLREYGAVSEPVAKAMAFGARNFLKSDIAISVTGLAGPDGDAFGNPVGTVFIGYCDNMHLFSRKYLFSGDRDHIREQVVIEAIKIAIEMNSR